MDWGEGVGKDRMNKLKFTIILCTIVVVGSGLYSCYNNTTYIPEFGGGGQIGGYGEITWVSRNQIKNEEKKKKKKIKIIQKIVDNAKEELESYFGTKVKEFYLVNSEGDIYDAYEYVQDNGYEAKFYVYLEKFPDLRISCSYGNYSSGEFDFHFKDNYDDAIKGHNEYMKILKLVKSSLQDYKYYIDYSINGIKINFIGEKILRNKSLLSNIVEIIKQETNSDIDIKVFNEQTTKYLKLEDYISSNEYYNKILPDYAFKISKSNNDSIQNVIENELKVEELKYSYEKRVLESIKWSNPNIPNNISILINFDEKIKKNIEKGLINSNNIKSFKNDIIYTIYLFDSYENIKNNLSQIQIAIDTINQKLGIGENDILITTTSGKNYQHDGYKSDKFKLEDILHYLEIYTYKKI